MRPFARFSKTGVLELERRPLFYLSCLLAAVVSLSACGGKSLPNSSPLGARNDDAAVMGDNQAQVKNEIAAARAAGKMPAYVAVHARSRTYVFPVYSQVLRTQQALIVRAYGSLYVFRLSDITLTFGDRNTSVGVDDLPRVKAPALELVAESNRAPGAFVAGNDQIKTMLCSDCVVLRVFPKITQQIASKWDGISDPWQTNPSYTPWHSGSETLKPMFSSIATPGPCGSMLSAGNAYALGSCSGLSMAGSTGNPGPGFSSSACPGTAKTRCIAYQGKPTDTRHCDGSQYAVGSPISPDKEGDGIGYYVNNISNIWVNGVIVAVVYQVNTANDTQNFYFIQETNNGSSWNWGASVGLTFGPVNIGVNGGQTYNTVSAPTWFYPGKTPLPSNSTFTPCWPAYPMPK